jgi:phosphoglycerate-specific signal transduction histidine kinase
VIEKKTSPTMIEKADQFSDNLKKAEALINKIENIKHDLKQFRHIDESDYKTYPEILEDIDHLVMIRRT